MCAGEARGDGPAKAARRRGAPGTRTRPPPSAWGAARAPHAQFVGINSCWTLVELQFGNVTVLLALAVRTMGGRDTAQGRPTVPGPACGRT